MAGHQPASTSSATAVVDLVEGDKNGLAAVRGDHLKGVGGGLWMAENDRGQPGRTGVSGGRGAVVTRGGGHHPAAVHKFGYATATSWRRSLCPHVGFTVSFLANKRRPSPGNGTSGVGAGRPRPTRRSNEMGCHSVAIQSRTAERSPRDRSRSVGDLERALQPSCSQLRATEKRLARLGYRPTTDTLRNGMRVPAVCPAAAAGLRKGRAFTDFGPTAAAPPCGAVRIPPGAAA